MKLNKNNYLKYMFLENLIYPKPKLLKINFILKTKYLK